MSSSGESLKRALDVLNLSPDDFLTLLNAEMDDDESKVSASTMHRWLSGFTPVQPGVRLALRYALEKQLASYVAHPRDLTVLSIVSPGGSGRTPLAYCLAHCATQMGIKAAVVEWDHRELSYWAERAASYLAGRNLIRQEKRLGEWCKDYKLVLIDTPDTRALTDFDAKPEPTLSKTGEEIVKISDALLLYGQLSDGRNGRLHAFADQARPLKPKIIYGFGISGLIALHPDMLPPVDTKDTEVLAFPVPSRGSTTEFHHCIDSWKHQLLEDPLTQPMWQLTEELVSLLGWEMGSSTVRVKTLKDALTHFST